MTQKKLILYSTTNSIADKHEYNPAYGVCPFCFRVHIGCNIDFFCGFRCLCGAWIKDDVAELDLEVASYDLIKDKPQEARIEGKILYSHKIQQPDLFRDYICETGKAQPFYKIGCRKRNSQVVEHDWIYLDEFLLGVQHRDRRGKVIIHGNTCDFTKETKDDK